MCPDGWRLPTAQEFYDLAAAKDNNEPTTHIGTMTPGGGYYSPNPGWSEEDPPIMYLYFVDDQGETMLYFPTLYNDPSGGYWSSTESDPSNAYAMYFTETELHPALDTDKTNAYSVRYVHDQL